MLSQGTDMSMKLESPSQVSSPCLSAQQNGERKDGLTYIKFTLSGAKRWRSNFVYDPRQLLEPAGTSPKYLALSWILHNLPVLQMRKERVNASLNVTQVVHHNTRIHTRVSFLARHCLSTICFHLPSIPKFRSRKLHLAVPYIL